MTGIKGGFGHDSSQNAVARRSLVVPVRPAFADGRYAVATDNTSANDRATQLAAYNEIQYDPYVRPAQATGGGSSNRTAARSRTSRVPYMIGDSPLSSGHAGEIRSPPRTSTTCRQTPSAARHWSASTNPISPRDSTSPKATPRCLRIGSSSATATSPTPSTPMSWARRAFSTLTSGSSVLKRPSSTWIGTDLHEQLRGRGVDTVIITGGETDVCVLATMLGAIDWGFRVILVTDALCSSADETHDAMMDIYRSRFSEQMETVPTELLLDSWRRGRVQMA